MFTNHVFSVKAPFLQYATFATILVVLLNVAGTAAVRADTSKETANTTSHRDLSSNECLKKLDNADRVIASIAFKEGLNSSAQLKELVKRRPWGAGTADTADEIKAQLNTQSPFLIITLTKEQALTLDNHRDIIRWVLVQSTSKSCA